MYENPTWVRILMGLMMPFLGSKMKKRMHVIKKGKDPQAVFEEMLGKDCIPIGMVKLEGIVEKDLIEEKIAQLEGK